MYARVCVCSSSHTFMIQSCFQYVFHVLQHKYTFAAHSDGKRYFNTLFRYFFNYSYLSAQLLKILILSEAAAWLRLLVNVYELPSSFFLVHLSVFLGLTSLGFCCSISKMAAVPSSTLRAPGNN